MANWDNQHTKTEQEATATAYDEGMVAGYDADPNHLPDWWFSKAPGYLTARQRGYWFGRETRMLEFQEGN